MFENDDIQIIHADDHYITTFRGAYSNIVEIYDSLYKPRKKLSQAQLKIFKAMYPHKLYLFVKPATLQPENNPSCGIFAIIFITTISLGHDPSTYKLQFDKNALDEMMNLRLHLVKMFHDEELISFPRT